MVQAGGIKNLVGKASNPSLKAQAYAPKEQQPGAFQALKAVVGFGFGTLRFLFAYSQQPSAAKLDLLKFGHGKRI